MASVKSIKSSAAVAAVEKLFDGRAITVRGAREHNLKNVDLTIPRDKLVVFTGLVRLRQILAGVRHDLRRGPAALCRVAIGLCAPVPRDDAEARRRSDRRALAGDRDRAEDDLEEPALDRRHGHRDPRLHAPPVGARRHSLFARDRPADREPDDQPDGRSRARPSRAHAALSAGARHSRPQRRVSQGDRRIHEARLPALEDRRRVLRDRRRARARQEDQARHRGRGRSPRRSPRHGEPAVGEL